MISLAIELLTDLDNRRPGPAAGYGKRHLAACRRDRVVSSAYGDRLATAAKHTQEDGMRSKFVNGELVFDIITTDQEVAKIVRLAVVAGLCDGVEIRPARDTEVGIEVGIRMPGNGFAVDASAALLSMVAEANGTTPEKALEQWRVRTSWPEAVAKIKAAESVPVPA
jgi:hypothetical protein